MGTEYTFWAPKVTGPSGTKVTLFLRAENMQRLALQTVKHRPLILQSEPSSGIHEILAPWWWSRKIRSPRLAWATLRDPVSKANNQESPNKPLDWS